MRLLADVSESGEGKKTSLNNLPSKAMKFHIKRHYYRVSNNREKNARS